MTKTSHMTQGSHCPYKNEYQGLTPRVLFVCSAGLLRSATCATLGSQEGWNTRTAGTSFEYALVHANQNLYDWADVIVFVNRENYEEAKADMFVINPDRVVVADIPDCYEYMEQGLQDIIKRLTFPLVREKVLEWKRIDGVGKFKHW